MRDRWPILWQITACVCTLIVVCALVYKFDGCAESVKEPSASCFPGTIKEVRDHTGVDKNSEFVVCSNGKAYSVNP